jgi:hypothetical protein
LAVCTKRSCDVAVGAVEVEGFGIEATAAPGQGLGMFGVTGIGDGLKEVRVTGGAADILGWTGSGAGDAGSDARRGIDGDQALEGDAVLPVVTDMTIRGLFRLVAIRDRTCKNS